MATNFPTSLDTSTEIPAEGASVPLATNHVTAHQNIQDALEAVEAKVGVNSSAVTTSHDYKLGEVTSTDKAVGKTATQTLTNKTLTSPVVNTPKIAVGSDATGDLHYSADANGTQVRLPIGTATHVLRVTGGVPVWSAETALVDGSTTVKGVFEEATQAETTAGTVTGGTGARLVVSPASLAGSTPVFNGSALTNLPVPSATVGTHVVAKSEAEVAQSSGTYTNSKQIVCGKSGNYTIDFELKAQATYTAYGRIYKNGVAVGTERTTTGTGYTNYSEDISGFVAGDLIQIYCKNSTNGANMYVDKFRIAENAWQGADTY